MESIAGMVQTARTQPHLESHRTTSLASTVREITFEEESALFMIINQTRALHGWSLASAVELEPICKVWWKEFARYDVPPEHYETLYRKALDRRIKALTESTKNPPAIDAVTLLAGWIGENGLRADLHRQRIAEGRYLEANTDCDRCFGSGWESTDKGARRCDHQ